MCLWAERRKQAKSYGSCRIFLNLWTKKSNKLLQLLMNIFRCWFSLLRLLLTTGTPMERILSSWEQTYHKHRCLHFEKRWCSGFPKVECVILPWRVCNMYIVQQPWKPTGHWLIRPVSMYIYTCCLRTVWWIGQWNNGPSSFYWVNINL